MSKMKDLAYDIEQLYLSGLHPVRIAKQLSCPLSMVYDWLENESLEVNDSAAVPFDQWSPDAQQRLINDLDIYQKGQ